MAMIDSPSAAGICHEQTCADGRATGQDVPMIVESRVVGEKTALTDVEVPLPDGNYPLGDLLDALVGIEVEQYAERRRERSLLRILTPADLARGVDSGQYAAEARAGRPAPDVEQARQRAREAFGDGLYFVFVDDHQIEGLHEAVTVGARTRLRLIRLVALAGG
jgi:hypothetical protein